MRPEKKYLVEEVAAHLEKSDYVYLTDYKRITVRETEELRASLAEHDAEFHVVKNNIFGLAAKGRSLPDVSDWLTGPTAIVVGGDNPAGVAKVLSEFFKRKEKVELKGGVVNDRQLSAVEIERLAKLPDIHGIRSQLLGLFNEPARRVATVLNAVPQSVLNVLQARVDQQREG